MRTQNVDIETKFSALKFLWIKKLKDPTSHHPWQVVACELLSTSGGDRLFHSNLEVSTLTCSSAIIVCEALHSPSRYHLASLFPDWPPSDLSFSPRVFTFFTLFFLQLWSTFVSVFSVFIRHF